MKEVFIKSIGYYVPERRVSNEEVMNKFKQANSSWISDEQYEEIYKNNQKRFAFLGIKTRSMYTDLQEDNLVNMATKVCQEALEEAGLRAEEIECLIMSSLSNPFREPSFANIVAKNLGIKSADFFDINDTCNGFIKSMEVASLYIKSGKCNNVLIATCENPFETSAAFGEDLSLDDVNDINHKFSMFLSGSGAGAMVMSSEEGICKFKNYAEQRETDTWDASWFSLPYLNTPPTIYGKKIRGYWSDARRVASGIIKDMPVFVKKKMDEWGTDTSHIDYVISHQLGDNITWGVLDQLDIAASKSPINTFNELGNMASANIPVNLGLAKDRGIFKNGDRILLLGSGGGLSMLIAELEWIQCQSFL